MLVIMISSTQKIYNFTYHKRTLFYNVTNENEHKKYKYHWVFLQLGNIK
jgi:hypothetical protein